MVTYIVSSTDKKNQAQFVLLKGFHNNKAFLAKGMECFVNHYFKDFGPLGKNNCLQMYSQHIIHTL